MTSTRRVAGVLRMAPALLVFTAVFLGAVLAIAKPDDAPRAAPASSSSGSAVASTSAPAPAASSAAPTFAVAPTYTTGYAPMPGGAMTPKNWLPPGADSPDPGPSHVIFPAQKMTVRFNHQTHVVGAKLTCVYCHGEAEKSTQSSDWLIPKKHEPCTDCHSIDESDPTVDASPPARCDACHIGAKIETGSNKVTVQKIVIPAPNIKMNHKAHLAKGIKCQECHGEVGNLELATRDQMPRMKGCFGCHQNSSSGGLSKTTSGAKSDCKTCHLTEKDGVLKTMFASGTMSPPKWLKNAKHGSDWIERHKKVAGTDSAFCGNCHKEKECTDCHDGKTRPRSVHPNDWLNMHEIAARFDAPKCTSCHSTSNFCTPCHTRVGVANGSPSGVMAAVRFHPAASIWSSAKRGPGHHSYEAQKNITACVSCHVERDCVVCHGTQGVGGQGANPHGASFANKCSTMYAKNPRPCFVCHDPSDKALKSCQ